MSNLPSTEEMLADLAKVEGFELFWQALSISAQMGILTPGEEKIVASKLSQTDDGE